MRNGQAMLLTTLALGGAILGATTIAGFLLLNQLRATTDSEHSAVAIFAADAGVNWALFNDYCTSAVPARCVEPPDVALPGTATGATSSVLTNGATLSVQCYDSTGVNIIDCDNASSVYAIAKGGSLNSRRAFFVDLESATATVP
jgi:hypothetical protein